MNNPIKPVLTLALLKEEAKAFAYLLRVAAIPELYGATDGKAVGTYVEQLFRQHLNANYDFHAGNSAFGIDFPGLDIDLKVTSIKQPQSSCPFQDATQKVYGLGYHLLVMTYDKTDNPATKTATLNILNVVFIGRQHTADYQTTMGLIGILSRNGNQDDLVAFLLERNLPLDEIGVNALAARILRETPQLGYLTISNALQWRLQYTRAIALATEGHSVGVENVLA